MEGPRLHYTYQLGGKGRICLFLVYITLGGVWVLTMGHLMIPDFENNLRQSARHLFLNTTTAAHHLTEEAAETDWQATIKSASQLADDVAKGPQKRAIGTASATSPPPEPD